MIPHRSLACMMLIGLLALCGCDNTQRGRAEKTAATATPEPAESPTPTPTPTSPDRTWNMNAILDGASFKTIEWPGHPDWSYISIQNRDMLIHAQEVNTSGVTTLRFPLREGNFRFQAVSTLDESCTEQVVLRLGLTRPQASAENLFETVLIPGRVVPIDKKFGIEGEGRELAIEVLMAPGATNSVNARTRWSVMKLDYWGSAYPQAPAATSDNQYPSTASASQGQ